MTDSSPDSNRSKAILLKTATPDFLEFIGNGKRYAVPPYQRDYSWDEENWDDLWNDIQAQAADASSRHYMGAIVVQAKSDREFLVIDGQQRLATLSILALVLIKKLNDLSQACLLYTLHAADDLTPGGQARRHTQHYKKRRR